MREWINYTRHHTCDVARLHKRQCIQPTIRCMDEKSLYLSIAVSLSFVLWGRIISEKGHLTVAIFSFLVQRRSLCMCIYASSMASKYRIDGRDSFNITFFLRILIFGQIKIWYRYSTIIVTRTAVNRTQEHRSVNLS